jgi:(p)ppGpp synthase/HD superfamily hydrolase
MYGPVDSLPLLTEKGPKSPERTVPLANHDDDPEVAAAKAIATIAHRSQTDKINVPYIEHPRRVAARLDEPKHIAAAWLHDTIEDCGITAENLAAAGISNEVINAVVLLTRTEDNEDEGYYEAIRENRIALAVKLADIADNTDPERTARLEPEVRQRLAAKYENAKKLLGKE